jgi:multiple sugar transport system ATP-binding protein
LADLLICAKLLIAKLLLQRSDMVASFEQALRHMAQVDLERLSKRFPDGTVAVDEISLIIEDREFLVLVGPSGCGKSTTLRLIAGLEAGTEGQVRIGGRLVNDIAPKDRNVSMVFQNYALYPHMSVYKNLSFGLKLRFGGGVLARGLRRIIQPRRAAELAQLRGGIDQQVRQTATRLGIDHLLDRKPHQLSGGERQRVALGRAIVRNPAAFLFDEPLSNLDAKLRQKMRVELKRLHRELNATMIYVTHDQIEAMTLGDRVAVMNQGKILQVGRPLDVYQHPANLFVARFIGSVPVNLVTGAVRRHEQKLIFEGGPFQFESSLPADCAGRVDVNGIFGDRQGSREVVMGFRCEDVSVHRPDSSAEFARRLVAGTVASIDRLGDSAIVYLEDLGRVGRPGDHSHGLRNEMDGEATIETGSGEPLIARVAAATDISTGDRLELSVEPERVLWFDRHTGENLLKEQK